MTILRPPPLEDYAPPQDPITVLHVDDDLCVVDKPAGLLSVPGRRAEHADSMANRLKALYPEIHVVHRLDMDTSGLMVFARNAETQRQLNRQFSERLVEKRYRARLWGGLDQKSGVVEAPLICDWPNRPLQKVCHETGKPSTTRWEVTSTGDNATDVLLTPVTGRSHQLRVHMLHIGHPILGDRFYAPSSAQDGHARLMLHAQMLAFTHPATGTHLQFTSEAWT